MTTAQAKPTDATDQVEIDFRAIVAAFRRNLIWVVAIVVGFLILGALLTLLVVPQYVATSRVLVEMETDQIIEGADTAPAAAYQDADRFLQTEVDILRSRSLAQRVVEQENLAESARFFEAQGIDMPTEEALPEGVNSAVQLPAYREEVAIDALQDSMNVTLPMESRIVSISFESADPQLAATISNATAEAYIASNLSRKFDSSAYARDYLAQELADARAKLEQSERDLNQYSRAAGLIRVSGQGQNADQETTLSITNDALQQFNAAASEATARRITAQQDWESISNQPTMSIPQVLQNNAVQALLADKAEAEAELSAERSRHLDDHPNVQALQARVNEIDEQIQAVASSIKRSVRLQYESALEREENIRGQVTGLRSDALNEQDRGVQYNVLKRVAETDRALYNTLLTRYNELSATAGASSNNVSLVDVAEPPRKPSFPDPILNMLVALLGGLVFASGFVFVREQYDDVIRSPDDVERKLGLSLLGLIPKTVEDSPQEELADPKSAMSEAYRSLLTNIRYSSANGVPKTIAITSSQPGEGKTTTSEELARGIADLGRKTLLIDADLRRPTLHKRTDDREREGFTTVLAGENDIESVVFPSGRPNLDYMTALPIPPNPAALLTSDKLESLLAEMRTKYDCIVLDAPPVLGLADATTLAAHVDALLVAIDSSSANRGAIKAALRRLSLVNAKILGAVLTKFDARKLGGEYQYYAAEYYAYKGDD
ncbi:polysaccharide biosynthesis tyrosine autokinase [Qipengyuania sp. G39]|uniref:non-specific protein-tyrosine kinase n=1 Tax=Qipengyuania profundimaris TaxID=3067652 RepID=A0ABT9HQX3_9SPHN|nr:polysaccharide biosynthesis tyrosine autokinase [Qipengyuania sp. G39]MDP4575554.1 polysaccharide biosynthesis tyrosine autokinase [Qipengyuania sp. G39]